MRIQGIVDQAFSIWYYYPYTIQIIIFGACFHMLPLQKGGVEMTESARRATAIPGMKVWSCIEDAWGT